MTVHACGCFLLSRFGVDWPGQLRLVFWNSPLQPAFELVIFQLVHLVDQIKQEDTHVVERRGLAGPARDGWRTPEPG
jgi:hypothetical protein